jgi:hypothetical protein
MSTSPTRTWLTIQTAARRGVTQWRLGLVWILATLIPTWVVMVPAGRMLAEALDHSIFASGWAQRWNLTVVFELMENYPQFAPALLGAAVISGLVTLGPARSTSSKSSDATRSSPRRPNTNMLRRCCC